MNRGWETDNLPFGLEVAQFTFLEADPEGILLNPVRILG